MSYRFLGIDTTTNKVVQFIDPAVTLAKVPAVAGRFFKAYGYRHWINTRPCNDVYDVVATERYYIASDRDFYASPTVKELVVYDRQTGNRISSLNIGCDCSLDITDDGSKVLYYNANSGYIEEANIPNLDGVTRLFNPAWGVADAIVKYIPASTDILIAKRGGTVVEQRTRTGTVVDSITTTETVVCAAMEPDNWIISTSSGADRQTLHYYRRSDKTEIGVIPNAYTGFLNIHVKIPFVTFSSDKVQSLVTEFGGVPFSVYNISTNCLYPILSENIFVGTYYFSIFEIPFTHIPKLRAMLFKCTLDGSTSDKPKIPVGGSWDISFFKGIEVTILSDQPLEITLREPIPQDPFGYARVYTSPTPEYANVDVRSGVTVARITMDTKVWGNIKLKNLGSADATVKIVGGIV